MSRELWVPPTQGPETDDQKFPASLNYTVGLCLKKPPDWAGAIDKAINHKEIDRHDLPSSPHTTIKPIF